MKVFFSIITVLALFACKDKKKQNSVKNETPTITIVHQSVSSTTELLCGSSFDNVLKIPVGDTIHFTFLFNGKNTLSQYKLDAHANFDCHDHGKSIEWSLLKIGELSGTEQTINETIIIPENVTEGNYHLMIRLLDIYGNEAESKEFNVILYNPIDTENPTISVDTPIENNTYIKGQQIHFSGTINDNHSLEGGKFQLIFTDVNNFTYNLKEEFFPNGVGTNYTINFPHTIGSFIPIGQGNFSIKAFDSVNNTFTKNINVIIAE